jgi:hypothetical protein
MYIEAERLSRRMDVSDRVELRRRLHCHDFGWFLTEIWPDHFLPRPGAFFGRVFTKFGFCVQNVLFGPLGLVHPFDDLDLLLVN